MLAPVASIHVLNATEVNADLDAGDKPDHAGDGRPISV
jgi:hypothetical protein